SSFTLGSLAGLKENQKKQRLSDNFKADDSPAGYMLLSCSVQLDFKMSSFTLGSLAGLKENQKEQRHDDNVFAIYPHMDGRGTATGGQFKDDDSPAGYMLLPCSVQLGTLEKL
ncbi:hypothetical protein HID58_057311, partial [Brassica napus]